MGVDPKVKQVFNVLLHQEEAKQWPMARMSTSCKEGTYDLHQNRSSMTV